MKFKISNIKWDTDGKQVELFTDTTIDVDLHDPTDEIERNEAISKVLSDQTGWCVLGYHAVPDPDEVLFEFETKRTRKELADLVEEAGDAPTEENIQAFADALDTFFHNYDWAEVFTLYDLRKEDD